VADGGKVDAQLMTHGNAGARFDERPIAGHAEHAERGVGLSRAVASHVARMHARIHPLLVLGVVRDGDPDLARRGEASAVADEEVAFFDGARLEAFGERFERRLGSRRENEPRGVGIEPMNEPRLARRIADLFHFRVVTDERVGERAGFAVFDGSCRLTGRLFDDDGLRGLESHDQRRGRLGHGVGPGRVGHGDDDLIALSREIAFARPLAVDAHAPLFEQSACAFAAEAGDRGDDDLVETLASLRSFDHEALIGHDAARSLLPEIARIAIARARRR